MSAATPVAVEGRTVIYGCGTEEIFRQLNEFQGGTRALGMFQ